MCRVNAKNYGSQARSFSIPFKEAGYSFSRLLMPFLKRHKDALIPMILVQVCNRPEFLFGSGFLVAFPSNQIIFCNILRGK